MYIKSQKALSMIWKSFLFLYYFIFVIKTFLLSKWNYNNTGNYDFYSCFGVKGKKKNSELMSFEESTVQKIGIFCNNFVIINYINKYNSSANTI